MERDQMNDIFNLAVSLVSYTNKSIFLTGKAGTGKTTFLKYIRENCRKKMAVTAPTGVAAINAGGVTLHSFFQLPFGTYLADMPTPWGAGSHNFYNKKQLLSNLRLRQKQREVIRSLDLLVIDEISMVRADLLDAIDTVLRSVRRKQEIPFGGVQLLFIGDLYQLPPVVTRAEEDLLMQTYPSPFFFDAKVMAETEVIPITLKKIYRQEDPEFIHLLNRVRNNNCDEDDYAFLQGYYDPTFAPEDGSGYITLTTHNRTADQMNARALAELPGEVIELSAEIKDMFPENAYPAEQTLRLKIGAQIMFIKNDKGDERRYFNGKIGNIIGLNQAKKTIEIAFRDEAETITIEPETWDNIRYEYDQEKDAMKEKRLGSFKQFPIRLAWAVTIHKSQGLTFDKAVIDAGRSFAPGQVYVALSRLTGLSGLILHSRILPDSIRTDARIQAYMDGNMNVTDYQRILDQAQLEYAANLLIHTYDWKNLQEQCIEHYQGISSRTINNKIESIRKASRWLDVQSELDRVGIKFEVSLRNYLDEDKRDFNKINERVQKASDWFLERVNPVIAEIKDEITIQQGFTRTKKYIRELTTLLQAFEQKAVMLSRSKDLTYCLVHSGNLQEAMIAFNAPIAVASTPKASLKPQKGDSRKISLEMYQAGKNIEEIAKERGLTDSTIAGHLTYFIPTGEVSLDLFVTAKQAAEIIDASKKIEPFSLTELKQKFGEKYTYPQLRAAMSLVETNKVEK